MQRKCTVHLNVYFTDIGVVNTDEAIETVKTVLYELHHHCQEQLKNALEDIGARDVELNFVAY